MYDGFKEDCEVVFGLGGSLVLVMAVVIILLYL